MNRHVTIVTIILAALLCAPIVSAAYEPIIPVPMTGNNLPSPYVSSVAVGVENGGAWAYRLFDKVLSGASMYAQIDSATGTWQIDLGNGNATVLTAYNVTPYDASGRTYDPKDWTIQCSNSSGGPWTTVDTRSGETFTQGVTRQFVAASPTMCRYYRWAVSANNGGAGALLATEWTLLKTSTPPVSGTTQTLSILNNVTGTSISGFCVSYTGNGTGSNCTSTTSLTFSNVTGDLTFNYYNISGGTFYNATVAQSVTGNATISTSTYQAIINVTPYLIFDDTGLMTFGTLFTRNVTYTNGLSSITRNDHYLGSTTVSIPAVVGDNNVMVNVSGFYTRNYTFTVAAPLTTSIVNATGLYDALFTIGAKTKGNTPIYNFSVIVEENGTSNKTFEGVLYNQTTTNGSLQFPLLQGYNYLFSLSAIGYSRDNTTILANSSSTLYNFSLYRQNTILVTFYDEETLQVITNKTIQLEMLGDSHSYNYTSTNGTVFADLLSPDHYILRYGAANYTTRFYDFQLDNNTFNALNLTLCDAATCGSVTVTVVDNFDNRLVGAKVKVYKYDVLTNSYLQQETVLTNFEGNAGTSIQVNNEFYKFIIEYDGATVFTSTPTYIYSTSVTFRVSLTSPGFNEYFNTNSISGQITNNSNLVYGFLWSDAQNTATQGCLYAYELGTTKRTLYNSTCAGGAGGQVFVTVNNASGATYELVGVVTKGGNEYPIASQIVRYKALMPTDGRVGLYAMVLVMIALGLIALWSTTAAVLLVSFVPLVFSLIGFVDLSTNVTAVIFAVGIIMAYILNR